MNEEMLWIWMTRLGKPANKVINIIYEKYGSPENAWNAGKMSPEEIKKSDKPIFYERLFNDDLKKTAENIYEKTVAAGCRIITRRSEFYPGNLAEIYNPPPLLYCIGKMPAEVSRDMTLLAVVGSRSCTSYGKSQTYRICRELSEKGIGIVSGLARGIDVSAHNGALDSSGYTVAVLGGGPDIVYPPEHRKVYDRIAATGCIISEHAPGTEPLRNFFPARNRIIAGMCTGTLVTEAGKSSGAMITVERALEEGRDVLAMPGNIDSPASEGTNSLLKSGAVCVTGAEDVMQALLFRGYCGDTSSKENNMLSLFTERERKVYECLMSGARRTDAICEKSGMSYGDVSVVLADFELKGITETELSGAIMLKKYFTE